MTITRRNAIGILAGAIPGAALAQAPAEQGTAQNVTLGWLGGSPPPVATGVSWGVPWKRGAVQKNHAFTLNNGSRALPSDIGGFAWDNTELATDMWLWYSFLRTGREDIFRMAEAMTRHTGEVDTRSSREGPNWFLS